MPLTLKKKLAGHIAFGLSVGVWVTLYASCNFGTVHARVLEFHVWIPHGNIA